MSILLSAFGSCGSNVLIQTGQNIGSACLSFLRPLYICFRSSMLRQCTMGWRRSTRSFPSSRGNFAQTNAPWGSEGVPQDTAQMETEISLAAGVLPRAWVEGAGVRCPEEAWAGVDAHRRCGATGFGQDMVWEWQHEDGYDFLLLNPQSSSHMTQNQEGRLAERAWCKKNCFFFFCFVQSSKGDALRSCGNACEMS